VPLVFLRSCKTVKPTTHVCKISADVHANACAPAQEPLALLTALT